MMCLLEAGIWLAVLPAEVPMRIIIGAVFLAFTFILPVFTYAKEQSLVERKDKQQKKALEEAWIEEGKQSPEFQKQKMDLETRLTKQQDKVLARENELQQHKADLQGLQKGLDQTDKAAAMDETELRKQAKRTVQEDIKRVQQSQANEPGGEPYGGKRSDVLKGVEYEDEVEPEVITKEKFNEIIQKEREEQAKERGDVELGTPRPRQTVEVEWEDDRGNKGGPSSKESRLTLSDKERLGSGESKEGLPQGRSRLPELPEHKGGEEPAGLEARKRPTEQLRGREELPQLPAHTEDTQKREKERTIGGESVIPEVGKMIEKEQQEHELGEIKEKQLAKEGRAWTEEGLKEVRDKDNLRISVKARGAELAKGLEEGPSAKERIEGLKKEFPESTREEQIGVIDRVLGKTGEPKPEPTIRSQRPAPRSEPREPMAKGIAGLKEKFPEPPQPSIKSQIPTEKEPTLTSRVEDLSGPSFTKQARQGFIERTGVDLWKDKPAPETKQDALQKLRKKLNDLGL